jgi:hypothetical protein
MEEKFIIFLSSICKKLAMRAQPEWLAEAHGQSTKCFAKRLNREETLLGEGRMDSLARCGPSLSAYEHLGTDKFLGLYADNFLPRASNALGKSGCARFVPIHQTLQTHFEVERLPARVGSFATKSRCPENDRQWKPVGSAKAPKEKFARSELCSRSSHPGCAK